MCVTTVVTGCQQAPESKVKRWATDAQMQPPELAPREHEGAAPSAPSPTTPDPVKVPLPVSKGCTILVDRACQALGPHTDECQEGRRLLTVSPTPEQHARCASIVSTDADPPVEGERAGRVNACRRLMHAVCEVSGASTWSCKQTRADASRLWRTGRADACLGDLLLWELRQLVTGRASGSRSE